MAKVFGQRHLQTVLLFCVLACAFIMRVDLSLAIVAMTDRNHHSFNPDFEVFQWSKKIKGVLLSSFFWGHCVAQIPASMLVHKFGSRLMMFWGMLLSILFTVLIPIGANIGDWPAVCALRIINGVSQAVILPGAQQVLARWIPRDERTSLGTYAYSGLLFGSALMLLSGGFVAATFLGWPGIFYLSGALSFVCMLPWIMWAADSPDTCKSISAEEKQLIANSLGTSSRLATEDNPLRVPWASILKSCPVYALIFANCSNIWFFWSLATQIPLYMANILDVDIRNNAILSSLPYFGMCVITIFCASFTAVLEQQNILSLATTRRLFSSIGSWVPAVLIIAITYIGPEHITFAIVLFTMTGCINALTVLGYLFNHIDLSPNYAGVLMALTTFVSNIMGFLAPLTAGFTVTDESNQSQWRSVFCFASMYIIMGNLAFIVFGDFEPQRWNDTQRPIKKKKPKTESDLNAQSITTTT